MDVLTNLIVIVISWGRLCQIIKLYTSNLCHIYVNNKAGENSFYSPKVCVGVHDSKCSGLQLRFWVKGIWEALEMACTILDVWPCVHFTDYKNI